MCQFVGMLYGLVTGRQSGVGDLEQLSSGGADEQRGEVVVDDDAQ